MEMAVETPVAHEDRKHTAQRIAASMFHQQPDWITFFREVLGVDGLLRKLFTTPEELATFEKTEEYAEIQMMLARLASGPLLPPTARSRRASLPSGCRRACTSRCGPRPTTARPA